MREDTNYILSLPGGGMRGYFQTKIMQLFCSRAGIDPNKIYEIFSLISGTSIGGITACAYAFGKSPQDLINLFETKASDIFKSNAETEKTGKSVYFNAVITGANSGAQAQPIFGSGNRCYFRSEGLEEALNEQFGNHEMSDLLTKCFVTSWNTNTDLPVCFSNFNISQNPIFKGATTHIKDACRATSAAPLYFPYKELSSPLPELAGKFIDGGVFCNNPSTLAYNTAFILNPRAKRTVMLNIGNGKTDNTFIPDTNNTDTSYNLSYVNYLINSVFLDGPALLNDLSNQFNSLGVYRPLYYLNYDFQFSLQEIADGYSDLDGKYTWDSYINPSNFLKHFDDFFEFHDQKANDVFNYMLAETDEFIEHLFA